MIGPVRSSWLLLIAIFMAGLLAMSAVPQKAMASEPMLASEPMMVTDSMGMGSGGKDCEKCDAGMNMMAGCLQSCPSPSIVGLADQALLSSDLTVSWFDLADVTYEGRSPPPAFTPPRTTILD